MGGGGGLGFEAENSGCRIYLLGIVMELWFGKGIYFAMIAWASIVG